MQRWEVKINTGVYQLLWWTCWLEEQHEPYMENTSKEFFSPTSMSGLSQSLNFGRAHVSIISACYTGSDIKATV